MNTSQEQSKVHLTADGELPEGTLTDITEPEYIACQHCGAYLPTDGNPYCYHCGHEVSEHTDQHETSGTRIKPFIWLIIPIFIFFVFKTADGLLPKGLPVTPGQLIQWLGLISFVSLIIVAWLRYFRNREDHDRA